jgi:phage replication-related protein YjqB (UPF0714/DUF867 family)
MTETPFAQLLATDGVVEECELRSSFGFMAFHGGSLEEQTDVIARHAATNAGASYYGVLQPNDLNWHIPSHRIDPQHSPTMQRFLAHVDIVVTIHGFGRRQFFTSLLLGGQNRDLADHVADHLQPALPAYDVITDIDRIPKELRGLHHANPVNLPRQRGVQIELPPRVRGSGPLWADWEGPDLAPHTVALIEALANAARTWTYGASRSIDQVESPAV